MYIRGLIPRNFAELAEAVPIAMICTGENQMHFANMVGKRVDNSFVDFTYNVVLHLAFQEA